MNAMTMVGWERTKLGAASERLDPVTFKSIDDEAISKGDSPISPLHAV